jgi:exodeoxyribonuclease VII small subunit
MADDDIGTLSYEAALAQLDVLIEKLEAGSIALDDAIAAYERGARLARHCSELLDRTERRVNALVVGADGAMAERPLDVAADPAPAQRSGLFPEAAAPPAPRARAVEPDDVPF